MAPIAERLQEDGDIFGIQKDEADSLDQIQEALGNDVFEDSAYFRNKDEPHFYAGKEMSVLSDDDSLQMSVGRPSYNAIEVHEGNARKVMTNDQRLN